MSFNQSHIIANTLESVSDKNLVKSLNFNKVISEKKIMIVRNGGHNAEVLLEKQNAPNNQNIK